MFNVALVLSAGQVVGAVPKGPCPPTGVYERRWFDSGEGVALTVGSRFGTFPLAQQLGFETLGVRWALELCEDLWSPSPPGVAHALAGAQLILNPSASPEGVGKAAYRRDLVRMASGQRLCGYLYAGASPFESSKDLVYGGHLLAAEAGSMLGEGASPLMARSSPWISTCSDWPSIAGVMELSGAGDIKVTASARGSASVLTGPLLQG